MQAGTRKLVSPMTKTGDAGAMRAGIKAGAATLSV
jgi:hypothetical protein